MTTTGPIAVLLLVFTVILAELGLLAFRQRHVPGSWAYGWALMGLALYSLMYALDTLQLQIELRLVFRQVAWIGIISTCGPFLAFVLEYTGRLPRLTGRQWLALWAAPVLLMAVNFTNRWHGLWFTGYTFDPMWGALVLIGGPVRMAAQVYVSLLDAAGVVLLVIAAWQARPPQRSRYWMLVLGGGMPTVLAILSFSRVLLTDLTPLLLPPAGLISILAIARFGFLDLSNLARRFTISTMPDGLLVLDQHEQLVEINQVLIRLLDLGHPLPGTPLAEVLSRWPQFLEACQTTAVGTVEYTLQISLTQRYFELQSSPLVNESSGKRLGRLILTHEVTERKLAEAQLQQTAADFRRLFEASPFPVLVAHASDLRVSYSNLAGRQFLETEQESGGTWAGEVFSETVRVDLRRELQTRGPIRDRLLEIQTRRGERRVVLANLAPFSYQDQDRVLIGLVDLTEQQRTEEALRQQQQALSVMEERERLAREVHDTLGQALSYVGIQTRRIGELIEAGQISTAAACVARLTTVVADANLDMRTYLLDLKSQQAQAEGFFPALREYLAKFSEGSGIQTLLSLPDDELLGVLSPAYEIQLLRVIQEALNNARKHSQATSAQVIITRGHDTLDVIVADNGVGFDAADSPLTGEGHFGLQIMRDRVADMGGTFTLRSAPGQGTQVLVKIPLQRQSILESLAGLKFMLVDDHPLMLDGLSKLLQDKGLAVAGLAARGQEAVERASEVHPDVILMDMHLPDMLGTEATRMIKASQPTVKVVALTLSGTLADIQAAAEAGVDGYLLKSLAPEALLKLLASAVQGEFVLDPALAAMYLGGRTAPSAATPETDRLQRLTDRQREILKLVAEGSLYKEIAVKLSMSESGVKYHIDRILERLEVTSRSEAAALAYQAGLAQNRRRG